MAAVEAWQKGLTQGRNHMLRLALLVSAALPLWFAVAALGTRFGLWDWTIGLGVMTVQIGSAWVFLALAVALMGLYAVLVVRPFGGWVMVAVALAIPVAALGVLGSVRANAQALPPIHDISTDPDRAPVFSSAVMALRGADANPVLPPMDTHTEFDRERLSPFSGRAIGDLQREAYPQIQPLILTGVTPADAFARARAAIAAEGWTIVTDDAAAGRLEATATSFWFGFSDDVVVMVTGDGAGARVDARSVSRVGRSDLGANAARLEALLGTIQG